MAVVDYDVHHGNGTQAAFYDDPSVLFISSHQFPYYPGTGAAGEIGSGAGRGFTVNLPLAGGRAPTPTTSACSREVALPILRQFAPELILISAGFDAHADDPLGGMRLSAGAVRPAHRGASCAVADDVLRGSRGRADRRRLRPEGAAPTARVPSGQTLGGEAPEVPPPDGDDARARRPPAPPSCPGCARTGGYNRMWGPASAGPGPPEGGPYD